jgi:hypothetical protein
MDFRKSLPAELYHRVTRLHPYDFKALAIAQAAKTVRLDDQWRIDLDASCGRLASLAGEDLAATLKHALGLRLSRRGEGNAILVHVDPSISDKPEAYRRKVGKDFISITAQSDQGAMRALFHLRQEMLRFRAPDVELGENLCVPRWELRITSPVLHRGIDHASDYLDLPRNYLLNMARYGYNATFLYADWLDYMSPSVAGPMSRPGWKSRITDLRKASEYLGEYGIQLMFHINTLALPRDHKLFQHDPSMQGAQTWYEGQYCLCSSAPRVVEMYENAARELFEQAPLLAGAVALIGGECFLHCFTRPTPKPESGTNCPRCSGRDPAKVIAGVVNAVTRGACKAKPQAKVFAWPYSAFSWGDLPAQKRFFDALDKRTSLLSAFEKDDWHEIDGTKSYVFDYSISRVGPSPLYDSLQKHAKKNGLKRFAKTETSQSIEMFYVPRIPIMQRWAQRYQAMRDMKLDGLLTTWRFYGFCAQRTDEIVDYFNWADRTDVSRFLQTIAQRDFGMKAAKSVVGAWQIFSEAFAKFPYSGGITGFPYWRGPFYIGPAHPFIFDPLVVQGLSAKFCTVNPGIDETITDEKIIESTRELRYFPDATWTQPFGLATMVKRMGEIDLAWRRGVAQLEQARKQARDDDRVRLEDELHVSQYIGSMFRTASNLARFQLLREDITANPCTPKLLKASCLGAVEILRDEIQNAELGLKLVARDRSLGYSASYGYALDPDMIREKIAHSHRQIKEVIPNYFSQYAFHIFGSYETLRV